MWELLTLAPSLLLYPRAGATNLFFGTAVSVCWAYCGYVLSSVSALLHPRVGDTGIVSAVVVRLLDIPAQVRVFFILY